MLLSLNFWLDFSLPFPLVLVHLLLHVFSLVSHSQSLCALSDSSHSCQSLLILILLVLCKISSWAPEPWLKDTLCSAHIGAGAGLTAHRSFSRTLTGLVNTDYGFVDGTLAHSVLSIIWQTLSLCYSQAQILPPLVLACHLSPFEVFRAQHGFFWFVFFLPCI